MNCMRDKIVNENMQFVAHTEGQPVPFIRLTTQEIPLTVRTKEVQINENQNNGFTEVGVD